MFASVLANSHAGLVFSQANISFTLGGETKWKSKLEITLL